MATTCAIFRCHAPKLAYGIGFGLRCFEIVSCKGAWQKRLLRQELGARRVGAGGAPTTVGWIALWRNPVSKPPIRCKRFGGYRGQGVALLASPWRGWGAKGAASTRRALGDRQRVAYAKPPLSFSQREIYKPYEISKGGNIGHLFRNRTIEKFTSLME